MKRPVLILRPEPGASATAMKAREIGLKAIVRPLFEVRAIEWEAAGAVAFDAVMMTSANAARYGGAKLADYRHLPLFAVGTATEKAAKFAGFSDVTASNAGQSALIADISDTGCHRILYLAGRDRTPLPDVSFRLETAIVYASESLPAPGIPAGCVALLHSARAAGRLAEIVGEKSSVDIVAISLAVAEAVGPGWRSVVAAQRPQDAAMLALAASLCETAPE